MGDLTSTYSLAKGAVKLTLTFFDEKDVVHHVRKYSAHVSSVSGYVPGDFTIIAEVSGE